MRSKPIRVYLFGGLGNQLFQYYFGIYLSRAQNRDVIFDESLISIFGNNHGNELSKVLEIKVNRQSSKILNQLMALKFRLLAKLQRDLIGRSVLIYGKTFLATETGFVDFDFNKSRANIFFGYFQSSKYFELAGGRTRILEAIKAPILDEISMKRIEIQSQNTVGIHIRRGDYVNLSSSYGILAIEYYENALRELGADETSVLCVLSDDIEFAEKFLANTLPQAKRIFIDAAGPFESLLLFSHCQKICISNSTFGYWGAMLGNPSAVVAPMKWFRNLPDPEKLYPNSWHQVASVWES